MWLVAAESPIKMSLPMVDSVILIHVNKTSQHRRAPRVEYIMVRKDRTKPPYSLFYNDEAKYMKFLRSFGEMAVIAITDGKKMRSKLDTRGRTGIFVGYVDDHAGNVYRFINIQTKKIILSRDIQWLNSFWKEYKKIKDDSKKLVDVFYSQEEDEQTQEEVKWMNQMKLKKKRQTKMVTTLKNKKRLGIDIQMIGARKEELGKTRMTEFRQPLQVQSHLEMPGILVQLGHTQRT